jgi:hypothetical protein
MLTSPYPATPICSHVDPAAASKSRAPKAQPVLPPGRHLPLPRRRSLPALSLV